MSAGKVAGLFLGAAVGDALGWPQEDRSGIVGGRAARIVEPRPEFRSWRRHGGTQFGRYVDPVQAGEYSDDTQLMLAVAHSCARGDDWYEWFTRIELPQWISYQRGGGGAILRASRAWSDGIKPWTHTLKKDYLRAEKYFEAGANGVAMRIAPHAVVTATRSVDELFQRVVLDGIATHGHPRALVGGCIHALGIRLALRQEGTLEYGEMLETILGEPSWRSPNALLGAVPEDWLEARSVVANSGGVVDLEAAWERSVEETVGKLSTALDGLARGALADDQRTLTEIGCFGKESGSGTVTAVAALYMAARTATQPLAGLLRTAFLERADTDTLCSMTGSLLGALHGSSWLGELANTVQDHEHLQLTAQELAKMGSGYAAASSRPSRTTELNYVRGWPEALFDDATTDTLPDGRPFEVLDIRELETKTKNFVVRIVGRAGDRQTFVIDRVSKTPNEALRRSRPKLPLLFNESNLSSSMEESNRGAVAQIDVGLSSIEVKVDNLEEVRRFYSQILNFRCRMIGGKLHVGNGLIFSAVASDEVRSHRGVVINLTVSDMKDFVARTEEIPDTEFAWTSDRGALWLRDPCDNRIRITEVFRAN
ncbi:ADP-ribosylglycohydrolase family protein [Rhodococcus qingshengii]|uniref:ADP-ribosylglycohydrolase family protein n=1 Tax=Rhodococcus qingshengii TaxID=334542 RepID=UPI0035F727C3